MALTRIKGITIELTADTTKATKQLTSFERAANGVAKKLADIDKVLKMNPTSTVALTQKQEALSLAVEKTRAQLNAEKEALRQLEAGEQTNSTIKQQERLKLQIEETTAKLREAELAFNSFGSVGVQQLKAVGEKLQAFGQSMVHAGQNLTRTLTVPIVALGGLSVKELATFEKSMAQVGAVSQASGEDIDAMSAKARELAATTQFTAEETTQAYHYMALAGWEPTEMMDGLEGVLNLVAASGEDLGRVSDIVTDGLTMFGMEAQDSAHFADVLAVAMSHSNTNVDQLGDALKYVGPVAGSMGYNIEDLAVALGVMANSGIKGSTAGTTLRNILTNMAKPTDEVRAAMNKLGVSLEDGEGGMNSMMTILGQFRSSLGNIKIPLNEYENSLARLDSELEEGTITEEEYAEQVSFLAERAYGAEGAMMAQYAASIAGKRGMAGLLAIVSASDEDFNSLTESIYGADGAAEEMRKVMEDTLSGQLAILKSQVKELAMQFGEALLPTVRKVVEWLQNLVKKFQALTPKQKQTIAKIAAMVAAIGPLLVIGGKLIAGVGTFLTLPVKIVSAIAKVKAAFTMISSVVSVASLGWVAAIVAAIAAIVLIWKNWDKIKEVLTKVMEKIKEVITKVWTAIKDFFAKVITAIKDYFTTRFNAIRDFLAGIWTKIKDTVTTVWNTIKEWLSNKLLQIKDSFTTRFNAIRDFLAGIWTKIKETITNVWDTIKEWLSNKLLQIKDTFTARFNAVRDFLSNIWGNIKERIVTVWNTIKEWLSNKITQIKDNYVARFTAIRDFLTNLWTNIKDRIVNVWNSIREWLANKITQIKDNYVARFNAIRDFLTNIWTKIKERIVTVWNAIREWLFNKLLQIKDNFTTRFDAIRERLSNIWAGIKDRIVNIWNTIGTWLSTKISGIRDRFVSVFTGLKDKVANIFQSMKSKITTPIESARQTLSGIISRIKGLFPLSIGRIFSNLKLPHISVSGGSAPFGIGGRGSLPHFSVNWYAKAMQGGIPLENATIFGMNGKGELLGGGEAGTEWIVGQNSLLSMIQGAVRSSAVNTEAIAQAAKAGIENATINLYVDGKRMTGTVTDIITAQTNSSLRFSGI